MNRLLYIAKELARPPHAGKRGAAVPCHQAQIHKKPVAVANAYANSNLVMKPNFGTIDRTLRIIVGLGLIGFGVATHSWIGALGAIPLLTGFFRFCPVYCPLGLNTVGKNDKGGGCCGGGQCG